MTVVVAETQAQAEQYRASRKPGGIRIAWKIADLPAKPCELVRIGEWWTNPLTQDAAFWEWRKRFGDWRGQAERSQTVEQVMREFPGAVAGAP